jgi:hypothetical protein
MYTVTIGRLLNAQPAQHPAVTGVQYASLDDLAAAAKGELIIGIRVVSHRRCRTRLGAMWRSWRAHRAGHTATITAGDRLAEQRRTLIDLAGIG